MRNRVRPRVVNCTLLLTAITVIFACTPDEICFTDNDTRVKISFQKGIYSGTDSAFFENDTLIFSRITALGTDSIFVESDTLFRVVLPVNTGINSTTFIFESDQGNDTLELRYQRQQRLISVDCGPEQIINNLEAGIFTFDSLSILNPALLEPETVNVEVYR